MDFLESVGLSRRIRAGADNILEMTESHGQANQVDADAIRLREEKLRRAVLRGDEGAWRTFYDASFDPLFAFALWRCGRRKDWAEEIVQETWLVAVRRIRDFNPGKGTFLNWVRGISANVLRNWLRGRRRHASQSLDGVDVPALAAPASGAGDQGERIALALDALPERQEAVLRAKYVDQRSVADIAQTWGDTEKAVESLLSRARAAFRQIYGPPEINKGIQT